MGTFGKTIWAPALALVLCGSASSHEGLHQQIVSVTGQIRRQPGNASLYLKRGELHRLHRQWNLALADYTRAGELDAGLVGIELGRGLLFFDRGQPQKARIHFDRYLAQRPEDVTALITRARMFVQIGLRRAAIDDYSTAIRLQAKPKPEHYIERAFALSGLGREHLSGAVAGLDEGIRRLGLVITLELAAIDLDLQQARYDSALERVDRIIERSERKESWLLRRGEILLQGGRDDEARVALSAALKAITDLPAHLRTTRAVASLERRVRQLLWTAGAPKERNLYVKQQG